MLSLFIVLGAILIIIFILIYNMGDHQTKLQEKIYDTKSIISEVGLSLGLKTGVDSNKQMNTTLTGKIKGNVFYLEYLEQNTRSTVTLNSMSGIEQGIIHISYFYDIPGPDWSLTYETTTIQQRQDPNYQDIEIGHEAFDYQTRIQSTSNAHIISLLSSELRQKISYLQNLSVDMEVTNRGLEISFDYRFFENTERMVSFIQHITELPELMYPDKDDFWRLQHNSLHDRYAPIRLKNIDALYSLYKDKKGTKDTLIKALDDKDQDIAIHAATRLESEGRTYLEILLLKHKLYPDQVVKIIVHLGSPEYVKSIPALITVYGYYTQEIQLEIIQSLSNIGHVSAEHFLLQELSKNRNARMSIALTEALGYCGSIDSIEKLYKLDRNTLLPAKKNAIQQSIAQIQQRNGVKGDKGWLSVSELSETEGKLSLAQEEEGGLSLAEEE